MKTRAVWLLMFLVFSVLSVACAVTDDSDALDGDADTTGDEDTPGDGDLDGDVDGDGPEAEEDGDVIEGEGEGALDLSVALAEGETRVGQITREEELIGGPMAKARIGDYKIYNSRIRLIVEGLRTSDGWGVFGGTIADADIVRPEGEDGESLFSEYFYGYGLRVQNPETVEVVNDGTNGEAAVLRFVGPDANLPFAETSFSQILVPTELNTNITVEYVLPPDSDILEIHSSLEWTGEDKIDLDNILQIFIMGDGLKNYKVGPGFNKSGHSGPTDIYITAGRKLSYGFFCDDGEIRQMFNYEGINFYISDKREIRPGETVTFVRYVAITEGGVDPVLRVYNSFKETTGLGKIHGVVTASDGSTPVAGARVHVLDNSLDEGKNYINQAISGVDGTYELELPVGDYTLIPYIDGSGLSEGEAVSVAEGEDLEQNLSLLPVALLNYSVTDQDGQALPCKIFADRAEGQIVTPDTFGEFSWHTSHQWVVHSESGAGSIILPPGEYTITASRGYEYDAVSQGITLAADDDKDFNAVLTRVVDTTGFISSDFHIHTQASPDSDVMYADRVRSTVSEGIEMPIATDHDIIIDWTPTAETLGVTGWMHPVVGMEITTYTYGHFNAWPLILDPTMPNNGAFTWYYKSAPDLFAEVAEYSTHPILHVCHPSAAAIGGYFSSVRYDAETGEAVDVDNWSTQFDSIEIINGGDLTAAQESTMPAWYSFLNRGYRFAGTAGSDTHKLTNEVGGVRNWIASDTDDPALLDPSQMAENVRAQKLIVSTGPFVNFSIGEAGLGEVTTDDDGTVTLNVRVQAPLFMEVKRMTVIGNGEIVSELDISAMADEENPVLRYDSSIDVTPAVDTWYIVIVEGDNGFNPVSGKRPFAFTNPIYVDVDGNSEFDAPLASD